MVKITSIGIATEPYEVKTKILWNPSVEEIKWYARENPKTFIFTFITGTVEDMVDYSPLSAGMDDLTYQPWQRRVVKPFYLGSVDSPEKVAEQLIRKWCEQEYEYSLNLIKCITPFKGENNGY